jgi:monoterpene epsilon-lactone hydrolase
VLPAAALRPVLASFGATVLSPRAPLTLQRWAVEAVAAVVRPPRRVGVRPAVGLAGDWLRPEGATRGALLYLHGGGYVVGSARSHRSLAARLAREMGVRALMLDYRRAPEDPHPAALEDAVEAYRALLGDGVEPSRIVIAGDSAGGGLALALAAQVRDREIPAPAALGLICPWLDLTRDVSGPRAVAPREPILSPGLTSSWAMAYVGAGDAASPAISPLLGELGGLPPIVLHSAGDDLLLEDAERLEHKLSALGPEAELEHRRHPGLWHEFHLFAGLLSEADEAVTALGASLRARVAGG